MTAKIISCAVIVFIAVISCCLGFANRGKNPHSDESLPFQTISRSDTASDGEPVSSRPDNSGLLPVKKKEVEKYIRMTSKTAIRRKADNVSQILGNVEEGYEAKYLSEKEDYYKVRFDDFNDGWVSKKQSELIEKEVEITYAPEHTVDTVFDLNGTRQGEDLSAALRKYRTVGASVAVIKDGHVTYRYEYGYADKEDGVKVNENTKFRVASLSKVFTAMLAMAEVNDGKLNLDANISDYFPFKFCHPKYPDVAITTRMLLTHSAGYSDKQSYHEPLSSVAGSEEYYAFKPGSKHLYSNLSIGIAGAVVEKAANQTLSQYARDRFFAPMGIDASYRANYLSDTSLVANCYFRSSVKYSRESIIQGTESKKTPPGYTYYTGQSTLLISAVDLAKVITILMNDGQYEGKEYLSPETVSQMLTVQPVKVQNRYEQCIGIRRYTDLVGERDMYYHTGNYYGVYSLLAFDPADRSGVVIITSGANSEREDNTIFGVCNDVMDYCYSKLL